MAALAAVALALLVLSTIRPSIGWSDGDFALYVMHAMNLVHGTPYAETGYIHNPLNAIISPAAYPPGFPAVLAPVYAVTGFSIVAFKIVAAVFFIGVVALSYGLARSRLRGDMALVVAAFVALSPAFFERRDAISSDTPFVFWCLSALLAWRRADVSRAAMCIAVASVFMALLTRTVGFALVAALLADALLTRGPSWKSRCIAVVAAACLVVLINRVLQVDSATYVSLFTRSNPVDFVVEAVLAYGEGLVIAFGLSFGRGLNIVALLCIGLLAAIGLRAALRRRPRELELFLGAYVFILAVFPVHFQPVRYLLPVLPLVAIYVVDGAFRVAGCFDRTRAGGDTARTAIGIAIVGVLLVPYYRLHAPFAVPPQSYVPQEQPIFRAIEAAVPASSAILAGNPRVVALFTHRRSAIWPEHPTPEGISSYADAIGAHYIVLRNDPADADEAAVAAMIRDGAPAVLSDSMFTLYARR